MTTQVAPRAMTHDQAAWQIASVLLGYPDDDSAAALPLLAEAIGRLPARLANPLRAFLTYTETTPVLERAADYVATFDHRRRCCLYLTYYAHGDTRKRGMALLAVKNIYRSAGFELQSDELPDHLAVVLEFASAADVSVGRQLLLDHRAGIELLRLALEDARSPYADVLRAVCATLPPLRGDERAAVARLAAQGPPAEEVGLQPFAPPDVMPPTSGRRP
jgi:nitrate reductase delta subunit